MNKPPEVTPQVLSAAQIKLLLEEQSKRAEEIERQALQEHWNKVIAEAHEISRRKTEDLIARRIADVVKVNSTFIASLDVSSDALSAFDLRRFRKKNSDTIVLYDRKPDFFAHYCHCFCCYDSKFLEASDCNNKLSICLEKAVFWIIASIMCFPILYCEYTEHISKAEKTIRILIDMAKQELTLSYHTPSQFYCCCNGCVPQADHYKHFHSNNTVYKFKDILSVVCFEISHVGDLGQAEPNPDARKTYSMGIVTASPIVPIQLGRFIFQEKFATPGVYREYQCQTMQEAGVSTLALHRLIYGLDPNYQTPSINTLLYPTEQLIPSYD